MLYRSFGKKEEEASILGFGTMRLPLLKDSNGDPTKIDEEEAIRIIRHGIDCGVNYIDTAYPYHGKMSEIITGRALEDGYREKVMLATKLPTWLIKTQEDCDKYLAEQLEKLNTEYLDVYLLHALNEERWTKMKEVHYEEFLQRAKNERKIKFAGFSFHDSPELFKEILDSYEWDMCQLQYNYMEAPEWADCVKYAAKKGVAVVVMEPLLGGKLAHSLPDAVMNVFERTTPGRSAAAWALQWLYNQPEVTLTLSGMTYMSQVTENLKTASHGYPNSLNSAEQDAFVTAKKVIEQMTKVKCTACEYCMPCPAGVNIPEVFSIYNQAGLFNTIKESQSNYKNQIKAKDSGADKCVECGECEKKCPQNIEIIKSLKAAKAVLDVE